MPNRIIKDSICTSPNIDALSRDAEVFFYRLLVQCDDYGRMDARPAILRAKCYPLQVDTVTQDDIRRWFAELVQAELIVPYSANGGDYLQMRTWERHQQIRAKRSKYPDMIAHDINCNQMIADAPVIQSNPIQSEAESNTKAAAAAAKQSEAAAVFSCWKDNMPGMLTTIVADDISDLINTYGGDNVIRAITEAVRHNGRSVRYVSTILESWASGKSKPGPDSITAPIVATPTANGKVSGFSLAELTGGA
jgi:DnaD/phage-associated family protein